MNTQQTVAFNHASGTSTHTLASVIVTVLFVVAVFWAVIIMIGKLKALTKDQDIDIPHIAFAAIRVLAVVVIVLILVNV